MRVLLMASDELIRQGLKAVLKSTIDIEIVAETKNSQDTLAKVHELQPDVILIHSLPADDDGLVAARSAKQKSPSSRVLLLAPYANQQHFEQAMMAGVSGYELMDISGTHLANAIRAVYNGHMAINQNVLKHIANVLSANGQNGHRIVADAPPPSALTPRGLMVLAKLAQGLSDKEIAAALLCSEATVKSHLRGIYSKLRISNRAQAAAYAVQHGLTRPK